MKIRKLTLLLLILLAIGGSITALENKAETKSNGFDINNYTWLAGHWTGDGFGGVSDEVWSLPADGVMMGMYRNIQDGKVVLRHF